MQPVQLSLLSEQQPPPPNPPINQLSSQLPASDLHLAMVQLAGLITKMTSALVEEEGGDE